jgi:hypothetical protein
MESKKRDFENIADIIKDKKSKKPTAYKWQEMALRIIEELNIPDYKKSSVFKICKGSPLQFVESCLNDTKELCAGGEKWKYFFKLTSQKEEDQTK